MSLQAKQPLLPRVAAHAIMFHIQPAAIWLALTYDKSNNLHRCIPLYFVAYVAGIGMSAKLIWLRRHLLN